MNRSDQNPAWSRRSFVVQGMTAALSAAALSRGLAADSITLPFANGERPLVKYPQKRPLIRLTTRPPQLETPFSVFNESLLTPNDAFYVRYHLTNSPPKPEALQPDQFRLTVKGKVATPLTLSVEELKTRFEHAEVVAVNQCSGNSRGCRAVSSATARWAAPAGAACAWQTCSRPPDLMPRRNRSSSTALIRPSCPRRRTS
jgi:DMSO/TMAO reductase YedYZ molybdopterin-dependent catalytic subunit